MSRIFHNLTVLALPAVSALVALSGNLGSTHAVAQETTVESGPASSVPATDEKSGDQAIEISDQNIDWLIDQLISPNFKQRLAARQELSQRGEAAIAPVREALKKAGPERRARLQAVLTVLEANTFRGRLNALMQRPSVATAARLPQWNRYERLCGSSPAAVDYFIRLLNAEPDLFRVADDTRQLRDALQGRAEQLEELQRQQQFPMDAFAAVLFLASNNELPLRGATSTDVTACLAGDVERAFRGNDQVFLRKLVGQWILRRNISVIRPLQFSRRHQLPEGLELARRTLRGPVRRGEAGPSMMLIKEQGSKADIAVLESLFDPQRDDFNSIATRKTLFVDEANKYVCYHCDLALALAISMRGGHPFTFGFKADEKNAPPEKFTFATGSVGFSSEDDRAAALEAYRKAFAPPINP